MVSIAWHHLQVDVYEKFIWSSAEYVHNQFIEGKDKAFYLCPDRINDAEVGGRMGLWVIQWCTGCWL